MPIRTVPKKKQNRWEPWEYAKGKKDKQSSDTGPNREQRVPTWPVREWTDNSSPRHATTFSSLSDKVPEDAGSSKVVFDPYDLILADIKEAESTRKLVGVEALLTAKVRPEIRLDFVDVLGELCQSENQDLTESTRRFLAARAMSGIGADVTSLQTEARASDRQFSLDGAPASEVMANVQATIHTRDLVKDEAEVTKRYRDLESRYSDDPALLDAFRRIDPRSLDAFREVADTYFKPGEYPAAEAWYRRIALEKVGVPSPSNTSEGPRPAPRDPGKDDKEDNSKIQASSSSDASSLVLSAYSRGSIAELPADELYTNVPNAVGSSHSERRTIYGDKQDDSRSEASGISTAPSITSINDSIFSIASGSSMSSLVGPESAVDRLVSLLLDDDIIKSLCTDALSEIEHERFERNLRRLLKEFAVELRKEAACEEHRHAAHFVRLRARNSAYIICSKLSRKRKGKGRAVDLEPSYASEESGSDRSDDEVDDLQQLEVFIKSSRAINILRANLRAFIHPANALSPPDDDNSGGKRTTILEAESPNDLGTSSLLYHGRLHSHDRSLVREACDQDTGSEDEARLEHSKIRSEQVYPEDEVMIPQGNQEVLSNHPDENHDKRKITLQLDHSVDMRAIAASKPTTWLFMSWPPPMDRIVTLLKLKPKAVKKGKIRVRWKCKCGHIITDDFEELIPGALTNLAGKLDRSTNTSSNALSFTNLSRAFSNRVQGLQNLLSFRQRANKTEFNLPTHERRQINATESEKPRPEDPAPTLEPMYLLLLYNEGRHITRLLQLDLAKLVAESDKALFQILHERYKALRKTWLSWISLRTMDSINFVHFEAYKSDFVDVRKKDDLPPPSDQEYRYRPAPPELIPPIGSHYLVHVLQHPECAEEEPLCLFRFPKKLKEQLKCLGGMKPGWGLQIVECWDARKIWLLIFVFFYLGSLAIGVLWAVFEHSIQDAFAIAGYMVAFATVSVGSVQAILVM